MASKTRIAVVGAGITGLLTAQGLLKNGFEVVVYERDSSLDARQRDWTILIHWAISHLEQLLPAKILDRFPEAICNPHLDFTPEIETFPVYSGVTGNLVFASKTPGARRVSRQRLRGVLIEGLNVRWSRKVAGIEATDGGLHLSFEDHIESEKFDYVVGADGASSKIRSMLLPGEAGKAKGSGFMFASANFKPESGDKVKAITDVHPVCATSMGNGICCNAGVLYATSPQKLEDWTMYFVKIWKGEPITLSGDDALRFMKEHCGNMRGIFKDAVEWAPEKSPCWINEMTYWIAEEWESFEGRATLLGDAAHPMLPFRGQGLQNGIVDSVNYVEAMVKLAKDDTLDRRDLMKAFEDEMRQRGNAAVKMSLEEGEKALDQEMLSKMVMATKGHGKQ